MTRNHRYRRIVAAVFSSVWAILPEKMQEISDVIELRASGVRLSPDQIAERIGVHSSASLQDSKGQVAVLNLFGTFFPRANAMTEISGGISAETFARIFDAVVADESISAIVLNVDSPGGAVPGIEEAGNVVFNARGTKPIVAVANQQMASAAYWIGAQADEIVATPSACSIGSIGAMGIHRDQTGANEQAGVKYTFFTSAAHKAEGNPHEILSESAREHFQSRVDAIHAKFLAAVARGRGLSVEQVSARFGEGRAFLAEEALSRGMIDRIATLDQVLVELGADMEPLARHQPAFPSAQAIAASADNPRFLSVRAMMNRVSPSKD